MNKCWIISLAIALTSCGSRDEKVPVSIIEGTTTTLNGKMLYLVEAHHWQVRLDSTTVVNNKFTFSIPHDSGYVPYKVAIVYPDSVAPVGVNMLICVNEYIKPGVQSNHKKLGDAAFYLENGKVTLTELPAPHPDSLVAWKKYAINQPRFSYPHLKFAINAGRQTAVMYKLSRSDFGWIGKADSAKRKKLIASYKKQVADNPFAYVLLDDIYNNRSDYSEDELKEFISLFNTDLRESLKGRGFERYLERRLDPGAPIPDFSLRDPSGEYRQVFSSTASVNIMVLWASWCAPCRDEIPMLKELHEYFRNRGVNLVSVSIDKNETHWRKAMEWAQMDWPQFIVDSAQVENFLNQVNVQAIPAIIITDSRNGELRRFLGSDSTTKQTIIDLVESQLGNSWQLK